MSVINMRALKEWAKRSPTGRQESEPNTQRIRPTLTPEQKKQVDDIAYFFKTRSRDNDSY